MFFWPHDRTTTRFPSGSFPSNFMQLSLQSSFDTDVLTYGMVQISRIPQSWHSILASITCLSIFNNIKTTTITFHFRDIFEKSVISSHCENIKIPFLNSLVFSGNNLSLIYEINVTSLPFDGNLIFMRDYIQRH